MSDPAFRHRGVVEGFYGTPWSHADRLACIARLGAWGMNRYVHAPKEDPLHRERWREAYPPEQRGAFRELVARGEACGVEAGFALSPGLSIRYGDPADRRAVAAKLRAFQDLGARFFALALDDVPAALVHALDRERFGSLAEAHVALAHEVADALGPDATLWLVPTDYLGAGDTDYLEALGADLAPSIEVGWTGRTVLSPTLRVREAAARSALLRRPLLVWDNTPVADGPMRNSLHLNPYVGRDPGLDAHLSGVLLNPMQHAHASYVTLRCAARFLEDPRGYDAESAFDEACREVGAGAPEAFRRFAEAHRFSPLCPDDRDRELESAFGALRDALARDRDPRAALGALHDALAERAAVAPALRERLRDRDLAREIEPWIASHALETRRMQAAVDFLETLSEAELPKQRVFAFFALEARLSREPLPAEASYGARRVCHPQLLSMRDEEMALADDPVLLRDRCLADALVDLAETEALRRLRGPAAAGSDRKPSA